MNENILKKFTQFINMGLKAIFNVFKKHKNYHEFIEENHLTENNDDKKNKENLINGSKDINSLDNLIKSESSNFANIEEIEKEKQEIIEEIDFIIQSKNHGQFEYLMNQKIMLTPQQFEYIWENDETMLKQMNLENPDNLFKKYVKNKILTGLDDLEELLGKNNFPYMVSTPYKRQYEVFFTTKEYLFDKDEISYLYKKLVKVNSLIAQHKSKNSNISEYVVEKLNLYTKCVQVIYNQNEKNSLEKLAQRAKIIHGQEVFEIKEKIKEEIVEDIKKRNIPPQAMELYVEIKNQYIELSRANLEIQQQQHLKNLFENRLRQVLTEYLHVPASYKKKMMNDKSSPDELLKSSLIEIKNQLSQMLDVVGEKQVNDMKVSNKYLKSM